MKLYRYIIILLLFVLVIPGHHPAEAEGSGLIVFDYSHGQHSSYTADQDQLLATNLTAMGYTVEWALGGINSSILSGATGLIIGSVYGDDNGFTATEFFAIQSWFNQGHKFMWVSYDSDYGGSQPQLDNSTEILESVGSHVYAEPSQVSDPISNCVEPYRVVATYTSPLITDVDAVLMHGPNLLYGCNGGAYGVGAVALETESISGVEPLLYYSDSAVITDTDLIPPIAHVDGETGAFVACTIETIGTGAVVVSGASPYGDYQPMCTDEYYGVDLDGMSFVTQVIDMGMNEILTTTTSTTTTTTTTSTTTTSTTTTSTTITPPPTDIGLLLILGGSGFGIIALLGLVIFMKRRKPPSDAPVPFKKPPPTVPPVTPVGEGVEVFRGCAAVGGRFEYKVKIVNNTPAVITDINVSIMSYPDECLEISGPTIQKLKRIGPGEFRSPQFIFLPTENCVEGRIRATVSYLDYQDKPFTLQVEPYMIRSVCDLLTPIEYTMEQFDQILSSMDQSSEEHTMPWNPEVLFSKVETFLPSCNFHIIEAAGEAIGGMFTGKIKGLAEGKHNKKKVAVRISITGQVDANESRVIIEGLGEDIAMIPTTIYEISQGIDSWTCMNCGAAFDPEYVTQLKTGIPVRCKYCEHTMTIDLYKK